jgi:hypothetical protein
MTIAEVLHRLVENSHAFGPDEAVAAHTAISDEAGESERHYSVPGPEAVQAAAEDKAARIAALHAELAELEPEPAADADAEPETAKG